MAYITQDQKKQLAPGIKQVLKKYGVKGSISIRNGMSLVVNLQAGEINFARSELNAPGNHCAGMVAEDGVFHNQVNTSHVEKFWSGDAQQFLLELVDAMKAPTTDHNGHTEGWYNRSDYMTDYFDIKYYTDINIGRWDKGYKYTPKQDKRAA